MAKQGEIWKYFDIWRAHVTGKRILNRMLKETDAEIVSEYSKKGNVIAWDVEFKPQYITEAQKILKG